MDISLGLEDTHVLVTGGAGLIGTVVVKAFIAAGAKVSSLDISYTKDQDPPASDSDNPLTLHADTTDEQSLFSAFELAYLKNGPIQVCVALAALDLSALPHHASAADMPLEQFRRTIDVNVVGTFATARQWLRGLKFWAKEHGLSPLLPNVSLIIVGSESGHWGEAMNADYGTSKGAVQYGLLQSLRQDVPKVYPGARVNAIAPGAVNTNRFKEECKADPNQFYSDAVATTALSRPVEPEDVARSILYLASERFSRSVHGQILNVDSGKVGKLVYTQVPHDKTT